MKNISFINTLDKFHALINSRYLEFESKHDEIISELAKNLKELGCSSLPDFHVYEFSFINDWTYGDKSSREVKNILSSLWSDSFSKADVARNRLTRKLLNFTDTRDGVSNLIKEAISRINLEVVPVYIVYLSVMENYFNSAAMFDEDQEKLQWIELDLTEKKMGSFYINQVIRQIDTYLLDTGNEVCFSMVGDNVIQINELREEKDSEKVISHWIFGPSAYISQLCKLYNITIYSPIEDEVEVLEKLIEEYVS